MFVFNGKTALVTGASSGIGQQTSILLAKQGCNLILVARSEDKLINLKQLIEKNHSVKVQVFKCDLTKPSEIKLLSNTFKNDVDILINNAGLGYYGLFENLDEKKDKEQTSLNIDVLVTLTRAFLPNMIEKKQGVVVNIASTAAFQPLPKMAVYGATKAFVLSFTEAIYQELSRKNIRCIAICPGPVRTNFEKVAGLENSNLFSDAIKPEKVAYSIIKAIKNGNMTKIVGLNNFLLIQLNRFGPRKLIVKISDFIMSRKR